MCELDTFLITRSISEGKGKTNKTEKPFSLQDDSKTDKTDID